MQNSPVQIAVVDDEESVRKAVERLLRSAGMAVETFPSGTAFLNFVQSHAIDCVVLDLHMSVNNGFDVQQQLARLGKELPVIILTGHDTADSRARAFANGAVAYLLKPVDDQVLLDAIATAIACLNHNEES